ncbi:ubiquitin domain-containing protein [Apiospora arundinis]
MGCCFSTPNGPNAPYPGGAPPSSSARAINSPRLAANNNEEAVRSPRSPHSEDMRSVRRNRRQQNQASSQQPLSQHIDKPLRRHTWVAKNRTWTRAQLVRERKDFFDTRVTGRPEIWQTIHAALEVLWEADAAATTAASAASARTATEEATNDNEEVRGEPESDDTALATAQSILKAAEVTLPTGNLANGVYDALGTYYALPEWIVCDPVNVVEGQGADPADPKAEEDLTGGEETAEDNDDEEALRRREEKGKAVADVRDLVKIRARLSENSRDLILTVGTSESVRSVIRKIKEEANLPASKGVRLSYMGKILKENTSLFDQGFQKGHVVNAFVFTR